MPVLSTVSEGKALVNKHMISMTFVNIAWGLSFILSKHALNVGFPPMVLAFFRYLIASVLLTILTLRFEKKPALKKQDYFRMFLSGVLGITLYYYFEYTGIKLTSSINASLILASIPVLTLLTESVIMRSRLTPGKLFGSMLSVAGVALIVIFGKNEGHGSVKGDLLIVGASVVWVGYIFISKQLRERYSSLSMNMWQAMFGLITLAPFAFSEMDLLSPTIPFTGWLSVFLLAVVCSALCYWLYGSSLQALSPLSSAIFINIIPLTTIIGSTLFLSEQILWPQMVGGGAVLASIFIVTQSR